jgi:hypothetical protein
MIEKTPLSSPSPDSSETTFDMLRFVDTRKDGNPASPYQAEASTGDGYIYKDTKALYCGGNFSPSTREYSKQALLLEVTDVSDAKSWAVTNRSPDDRQSNLPQTLEHFSTREAALNRVGEITDRSVDSLSCLIPAPDFTVSDVSPPQSLMKTQQLQNKSC